MQRFRLAAILALTLGCAAAASAQTPIGAVDFIDNDSVIGWACLPGDADTFLPVEVWAYRPSNGSWTYVGTENASRGRDEVGSAGVCGSTAGAFYHGFELTIFPEELIATQGSYQIYAYSNGTLLPQNPSISNIVSFATSGFPGSTTWRTDYNDPNQRSVSMVSCIWPFKGANPDSHGGSWSPATDNWDPYFLPGGATNFANMVTQANWCLRNDRTNPTSWYWTQSNSATNASTWPTTDYWVISANTELAYSKSQSGPPSQSEPINAGDIYSVAALTKSTFKLGIDNTKPGHTIYDIPFLSIGAQMGRGQTGPIGWIQPTGQDTHLQFQVKQVVQTAGHYHDIAAYIEMMWGGYKRFIGISLTQDLNHRYHWNWNALESFWFPGGEFNLLGKPKLDQCQLSNAQLPVIDSTTIGQTKTVSIPLRGLLQCLETMNIPNLYRDAGGYLGWSSDRPTNLPIAITGVHLAIEQGDGEPNLTAKMETVFSKPTLVNF